MEAYRDREEKRQDLTLWHGPFDGRGWRVVIPLVIALAASLILHDAESTMFRALVCQRPGVCFIERGSDAYGPWKERTFDPAIIGTVAQYRTRGKNARDVVELHTKDGAQISLFSGAEAVRQAPAIRRFFTDPSQTSLSIRETPSDAGRVVFGGIVVIALTLAGWFAIVALAARSRTRIEIDHGKGILRIEKIRFGKPVDPVDVPIRTIVDIVIERDTRYGEHGGSRVLVHRRRDAINHSSV